MSNAFKNVFFYIAIVLFLFVVLLQLARNGNTPKPIDLTALADTIAEGHVTRIQVEQDQQRMLVFLDKAETPAWMVRKERLIAARQLLLDIGVAPKYLDNDGANDIQIEVLPTRVFDRLLGVFIQLAPLLLFGALLFFLFRQAQGGTNQALQFGRSRARLLTGDTPTVTFDDVAGVDEARQEVSEIVEFLQEPEKFITLGARIPRGVLMVGPPGCGKTLLARAIAGEAGVPFFSISGSEFVEMFVGVGASRVRDLFEQAKKHSPCIIFIDEIDAVGRHRGAGLGGSHDEREQTLNQILVEMDGFGTDTNIIVIAATNRPDILDPALLRPGRFDRQVIIDRPDVKGRRAILAVHTRGKPMAADIDLDAVARQTPGFAGADLENLINEAAIQAARRNSRAIYMPDVQEAIEKIIAGPERRSRIISDKERKIIAYHEAGHALVMANLKHCDPVHKITIVSRGMALGYTMNLPTHDRTMFQRSKFEDDIAGLLGGRVAEEVVFDEVTTGASNDLERVTRIARDMVTRYGMSETLGPLTYGEREEMVFLGREIGEHVNYSQDVAETIDAEVRRIVTTAHKRATDIIKTHIDKLHAVSKRLMEKETIDAAEFQGLVA
ncbi:MAG: ATP-dependent zinc metalloprotease FtsH [Ardenticatenales bacterium]|nr:ATP-dependent zinc metalloprotease FtsH [Ardenticatenales bacterium]